MARSNWQHVRSVLRQVWVHPSNRDHRPRALARAISWQVAKRSRPRPHDLPFFGFTMRCYPDSNSASNVVYFTQRFDPEEMRAIEALLSPGDGFIDVGANIGTYSLLARSLVGPTGHVDAYEAHPAAAARMVENVELNRLDNVRVHQAAVADAPGAVEFLTTFDVSNSILTTHDAGKPTISVPAVTLDASLEGRSAAVGKIDIEGFEVAAFRGAADRLAAADPPVWLTEVMEWQLQKAQSSTVELIDLMRSHRFETMRLAADAKRFERVAADSAITGNVWFVHADHLDRLNQRLADAPPRRSTTGRMHR